jgi:Protein of unknown function (DUF4199)
MENFQENSTPSKSISEIAVGYGLIGGAAFIVYSLLLYITDAITEGGITFGILNFAISLGMLVAIAVYAIRELRKQQGGLISFGEAFRVSFFAMTISTILTTVFNYVYIQFIDPGMVDKLIRSTGKMLQKFNMPPEEIEKQLAELPKRFELQGQLMGLLINVVFGAIIGLICARSMKKNQDNPFKN